MPDNESDKFMTDHNSQHSDDVTQSEKDVTVAKNQNTIPSTMKILIVDDSPTARDMIRANLEMRGYKFISEAGDGIEAINQMKENFPDLILLDLAMPRMGGIAVCEWVRKQRQDVPIIVLSAVEQEQLVIDALDAGADDYVQKPYDMNIVLARIRAVLRRVDLMIQSGMERNRLIVDKLVVDFTAKRVFIDDNDLRLTRTEFALLSTLAKSPDVILSHDELLEQVWGPEYRGSSHYLHVYLGRVRKKLGEHYSALLETVSGLGYVLYSHLSD